MTRFFLLLAVFLLCSCVSLVPQDNVTDENAFEHMRITRGSSVYGNVFFKSKTGKPLGNCLQSASKCTKEQLAIGEPIEAQYYEVDLSGMNMSVTNFSDKLFMAAAMITLQEGFRYFTPLLEVDTYFFEESPYNYTSCTSSSYSIDCSTSEYNNISSYTGHNLSVFAYNNYDDIKNGVLYDSDGYNVLHSLYGEKEDKTNDLSSGRATRTMYYKYYDDAWKIKYDAIEILSSEGIEIKQFEFKDEPSSPKHVSIREKYKQ